MAVQPQIDEAKVEAFMGKVIGDFSGAMMTMQCALGGTRFRPELVWRVWRPE